MSIHLSAKAGDIADTVLLPGDPLRARFIADTMLQDARCYNEVRGMFGFTGTYKGKRVSVQGTGMGLPSVSIYVNELIRDYGVRCLVRIGTCGGIQSHVGLREVVLAQTASTDSQVNRLRFHGCDFAPSADFGLLLKAYQAAQARGVKVNVGNVLTTDQFYQDDPNHWKHWAAYGVLALEMESAGIYTLAAKYGVRALSLLTVSDHLVTGGDTPASERERSFTTMVELALEAALG